MTEYTYNLYDKNGEVFMQVDCEAEGKRLKSMLCKDLIQDKEYKYTFGGGEMTREEILDTAKSIVCGERQDQYGNPEDNFERIADLWTAYLNFDRGIEPEDVACMMMLLKMARIATGTGKDDNWVDIAGYAACGGEIFENDHNR